MAPQCIFIVGQYVPYILVYLIFPITIALCKYLIVLMMSIVCLLFLLLIINLFFSLIFSGNKQSLLSTSSQKVKAS